MDKSDLRRLTCKVCKNTGICFFCRKGPAVYYRCGACGFLFQHPLPDRSSMLDHADTSYQAGEYSGYVVARDMKHAHFRQRLRQFQAQFPAGKLLDIGCSCGYFLDVALESGYDAYGIEFSGEAIAAARPETKERITQGNVNDLATHQQGTFDVVTAFDIIEHMDDPLDFLQRARSLLKKGGGIVVSTPDNGHFLRHVMGKRWPMLQPLQHTSLFSRKSLCIGLRDAGFRGVEIATAYKVISIDYLFGQIKNYNPVIYAGYRLASKVVGKSRLEKYRSVNIGEMLAVASN